MARFLPAALVLLLVLGLAACAPNVASPSPGVTDPAGPTPAPSPPASPAGSPSVAPSPITGFAFDPESIVGYFQSIGYSCTDRQPSASAAGHEFQSCQLVDSQARTRTVGIVTDPDDNVADAFLSIRGAAAEPVLDPSGVLEPFAAFLGAFLGEEQGSALLPWLAAHLGDADVRTTLGDLTIAAYTDAPDDHSKLTLEIASREYLDAPPPEPGESPPA